MGKITFIKNKTRDYIRIGREDNNPIIYLEPREIVLSIDPVTRERVVKQGVDVMEIDSSVLAKHQVRNSVNRLIEVIPKAEYDKRIEQIYPTNPVEATAIVGGPASRGDKLEVVTQGQSQVEDSLRIPMDSDTLSIYPGAESGTVTNKK